MKKIIFLVFALAFVYFSTTAQNQHIIVGKNYVTHNEVTLVAERGSSTTLKFDLNELNLIEVETDYGMAIKMSSEKAPVMLEAGAPELLYLPTAIVIPDIGSAELSITYGEYTDIENVEIAPSKGNLSRSIDPATVPYVKGEVYNQNAFFPGNLAEITETFIMRDVRGVSIFAYPVQYNPVTKVLRIYSEITITVNYTDQPGENEFNTQKRHDIIDPTFNQMYNNMFINYSSLSRDYPTGEEGELLIVCHPAFMDAMQDYIDWKRTIGRKTTIVPTSAITPLNVANIKSYIANYYNNPGNNLAYVLLVGDVAQIPVHSYTYSCWPSTCTCYADVEYGKITGGDHYLEVLIGRMSAENIAQVETQVERSIWYERNIATTDTWLNTAIGIAAFEGGPPGNYQGSQGGHDGNEADYTHMNNIRTRLLNYGYNPVYQEYAWNAPGTPNTTVAQITSRFNGGAGIANYCNHGSKTAWTLSTGIYSYLNYGITEVNALQNAGKLPFIFSVACNNGEFPNGTCFAEAWMRATKNNQPTGAIATLMATVSLGWEPPMTAQDEFVDICLGITHTAGGFNYGVNGSKRTFAGAALNATQRMLQRHGVSGALEDYNSWTVFGDPTLMVRTKTPQAMTVTHNPTITAGATSFAVTCNAEGALAALTYMDGTNGVVIVGTAVVQSGIAQIYFSVPLTIGMVLKLAVTGFDKVTYVSEPITVTSGGPLLCEKPVGVSGTDDANSAIITWNQPAYIDGVLLGYNVYRDESKINESIVTAQIYHDLALDNGTYTYQVSAEYEHCESELTEAITVAINYTPSLCEKPIGLSGTADGYDVTITWYEPGSISGILLGYNVYRDGSKINESIVTAQIYHDLELANGTYSYQINAVYEHCESELTEAITIVVNHIVLLCEKPIGLAGTDDGYNVTVTWDEPEIINDVLLGYNVYRDGTKIDETSETKYLDNALAVGTYSYQVSAKYENCEESELTDEVVVEIMPQLCEEPVNLDGYLEENTAVITWDLPENIDGVLLGYNVYRDGEIVWEDRSPIVEEFRDKDLEVGTYIYNVSAVYEHCGESELTDGVTITIIPDAVNEFTTTSFEIYPNPTNGNVTFEGQELNRIEIYDVQGRKLIEYVDISETLQINVNQYENGIYFVRLISNSGEMAVKRLVVIKN